MNRDSVPMLICVVALVALALITWVMVGPPAASAGCYLQARPRHRVGALNQSPSVMPLNDQQCVGR